MIKVSIMYPNGPETTFDVDYYKNNPPMIAESLGTLLKAWNLTWE
jgi:hypothetical protein